MHGALVPVLAVLFSVVLLSSVDPVAAGVRTKTLEQVTGAFPTACGAGQNQNELGSQQPDLRLGNDTRVSKKVSGDEPEQVHFVAASPTSYYFSWATGNASYNFCNNGVGERIPSNVTNGDKANGCLFNQTVAQKVGSEVLISKRKSFANYKTYVDSGPSYPLEAQYTQVYAEPSNNKTYRSPIIHTVRVEGLKPNTRYYYRVGSSVEGADSKGVFSTTASFKTLPAVGTQPEKPTRIGVIADLGTTEATAHVMDGLVAKKPDIVFLAGDHTYADNHQNDQRYWDSWFRLLGNSTRSTPWQPALGNHEEETQMNDCLVKALASKPPAAGFYPPGKAPKSCGTEGEIRANCPNPDTCPCAIKALGFEKGFFPPEYVHNNCNQKSAFVSATTRWPAPYHESGSGSPHFYSFEFGLVHAIVLSPYQPYCGGALPCYKYAPFLDVEKSGNSAQYEWLARDIKKIDRKSTPWVIVFFHNPWYTTFGGFKTDDCTRQALEPLLIEANVDLVFNGHIHAYERGNSVNNFATSEDNSACDPVHIVIGDAGNDETLTCGLIDEAITDDKLTCTGQSIAKNSSEGYYFSCHSPTFQDDPGSCLMNDKRVNTTAIPASYYGCPEEGYCPNKQPRWSGYRSAEYGSGLLEILGPTSAKWTWKGSFKQGNEKEFGHPEKDEVTFRRCSTDN